MFFCVVLCYPVGAVLCCAVLWLIQQHGPFRFVWIHTYYAQIEKMGVDICPSLACHPSRLGPSWPPDAEGAQVPRSSSWRGAFGENGIPASVSCPRQMVKAGLHRARRTWNCSSTRKPLFSRGCTSGLCALGASVLWAYPTHCAPSVRAHQLHDVDDRAHRPCLGGAHAAGGVTIMDSVPSL